MAREIVIGVRVTQAEMDWIERAARVARRNVSDYIRDSTMMDLSEHYSPNTVNAIRERVQSQVREELEKLSRKDERKRA